MNTFIHSGHIGDLIAFLPLMKKLGGGNLVVTDHNSDPLLKMEGFKYDSVEPLLKKQPYIFNTSFQKVPEKAEYDLRGFRKHWGTGTIIEMQAKELCIDPCHDKWLHAEPSEKTKNKIVCCRSTRYRNSLFPWHEIVNKFREKIVFIGVHDEYGDFCRNFGQVDRLEVSNCWDIACAIAGSQLFIGNQSSPFWIAVGLHHSLIQETCVETPDSIVPYEDAHYWVSSVEIINKILK